MKNTCILIAILFLCTIVTSCSKEEEKKVINYLPQPGITIKEGRLVWKYDNSLPSPYANADGSLIDDSEQWENRRDTLLEMLEEYVYGSYPELEINRVEKTISDYQDARVSSNAISYTALIFYDDTRSFSIRVTRPQEEGNYPVIMRFESFENFRFPIEEDCIKNKKYVIVALNHLSVAPDNDIVTDVYMNENKVLMAWAYAASLTVDYLETLDFADCSNICIAGMSRTGKAAICAGVFDKRFTIIVANNSGAAGASGLRSFDEDGTQAINIVKHQPTWVSEMLLKYVHDENSLPMDMHFARALVAPRVILTTEASDGGDAIWAGPVSTYKMWEASDYAFQLYNATENNLIHLREGKHAQLDVDYERMMQVIDQVCYGESFDPTPFRVNEYQ